MRRPLMFCDGLIATDLFVESLESEGTAVRYSTMHLQDRVEKTDRALHDAATAFHDTIDLLLGVGRADIPSRRQDQPRASRRPGLNT